MCSRRTAPAVAASAIILCSAAALLAADQEGDGWITLFAGDRADLQQHWDNGRGGKPHENWAVQDGAVVRAGKAGYLWTKKRFGDFVLDLEFKTEGNSGVFIRTGNTRNPVQTGLEVQILRSGGKKNLGKHDCGAIYDALAPTANPMKNDEWNRLVVTCRGPKIAVAMNGKPIIDMDIDRWTTARRNPDGSKNKYKTPLKDFPREGHIGLQEHGHKIMFRNIRIKPLKKK